MIINIEDLRRRARRRLPRMVFDCIEGGAHDEVTLRANRADFDRIHFRPRVLTDVSQRDLTTDLFGVRFALPLVVSPMGVQGMLARHGEIQMARAAERRGIAMCLAVGSNCSIEDVRTAVKQPFWFQMTVGQDRSLARSLIDRAEHAGCTALVLTVDTAAKGQRERDLRNRFTTPPRITVANVLQVLSHVGWIREVFFGPQLGAANLRDIPQKSLRAGRQLIISDMIEAGKSWQDLEAASWRDIDWVRSIWR